MSDWFETERDLEKERALVDRVIGDKFEIQKLNATKYRLDYGLFRWDTGNLQWFVEARCRTTPMKKYPTFFASLDKMLSIERMANSTGIPVRFLVEWSDATAYFQFDKGDSLHGFDIKWGGRNQMRRALDKEPMMHIPIDRFSVL